jgi:hypothetical protein
MGLQEQRARNLKSLSIKSAFYKLLNDKFQKANMPAVGS